MFPDPEGERRSTDEIDRRHVNVALIDHRLNEVGQQMSGGFLRLERKIDLNLASVMDRIERLSERQTQRAETLGAADHLLQETMEKRVTLLEGELDNRVLVLEKWKVQVDATLKTATDLGEKGLKAKHLWLAGIGVVVATGGLFMTVAAVVVTVLLSAR